MLLRSGSRWFDQRSVDSQIVFVLLITEMKTWRWETDAICATLVLYMWLGSRNCGCLVAWICYQLMAKPGSRTAAVPWPDPYVFTVYMTHRLSVYILYGHTNGVLILVTSFLHIHFSYVHECILTALYCAVFVLLMHVFLWLSLLLLLYIVRNDENKDDQSLYCTFHTLCKKCESNDRLA